MSGGEMVTHRVCRYCSTKLDDSTEHCGSHTCVWCSACVHAQNQRLKSSGR